MVTPNYPTALPTTNQCPTGLQDDVDDVVVAHQNKPHAEILSIAKELGTLPKGGYANVKTRLNDLVNLLASTPIFWTYGALAPDAVGQGTWVRAKSSTQIHGHYFRNNPGSNGDNFTTNFRCSAGTYTLSIITQENVNGGVMDVYIDGNEEGSLDTYNNPIKDTLFQIPGLTLSSGAHTLKLQVDGKHGSSSGYNINVQGVSLQRTA